MSAQTNAILKLRKMRANDAAFQAKAKERSEQKRFIDEIVERIRIANQLDPNADPELGWRVWYWDIMKQILISPSQQTEWTSFELRADNWSTKSACRGKSGIHACLMTKEWELSHYEQNNELRDMVIFKNKNEYIPIDGVVRRFGRYVLGTTGWRAECVHILKLRAPNSTIGLLMQARYPEVEIYHNENWRNRGRRDDRDASTSSFNPRAGA